MPGLNLKARLLGLLPSRVASAPALSITPKQAREEIKRIGSSRQGPRAAQQVIQLAAAADLTLGKDVIHNILGRLIPQEKSYIEILKTGIRFLQYPRLTSGAVEAIYATIEDTSVFSVAPHEEERATRCLQALVEHPACASDLLEEIFAYGIKGKYLNNYSQVNIYGEILDIVETSAELRQNPRIREGVKAVGHRDEQVGNLLLKQLARDGLPDQGECLKLVGEKNPVVLAQWLEEHHSCVRPEVWSTLLSADHEQVRQAAFRWCHQRTPQRTNEPEAPSPPSTTHSSASR